MKQGLVSVTFRELSVKEIIKLARDNGLKYIEWGGPPHVPMGNVKLARRVKRLMHGAGIKCPSYGSYYGVTYNDWESAPLPFKRVCKTAKALGASIIRIWAGWPGCGEIDAKGEQRAVAHTKMIANVAKKYGLTLAFECHWGTITEDYHRSIEFLKKIDCDNVKIYYQPNPHKSVEYNLEAARALLPWTTNVHVCNHHFIEGKFHKDSLEAGQLEWCKYLSVLENGDDRVYYLEFMPDGTPASLPTECQCLKLFEKEVQK